MKQEYMFIYVYYMLITSIYDVKFRLIIYLLILTLEIYSL